MSIRPVEALAQAVASYEPFLREDGVLEDPVLGEPTQYGTPYHAFCQATLAACFEPDRRRDFTMNAFRGLDHSLRYLLDPARPTYAARLDRATGTVTREDYRDYFWSPLMRTFRLLKQQGVSMAEAYTQTLAEVDVARTFLSRPPHHRAAVWLSGEWIRLREGLSPTPREQFDEWLGAFLREGIVADLGLYRETGHPNSNDIFVRVHLADILLEGYEGPWREALETLLGNGLRRSLGVQLSDGSLATAHNSSGQSWTVGAEIAFFTHAANFFRGRDPARHAQALTAARRAFASFVRWQRPDDPFSPVENLHPGNYRIGYEPYTMDGHYGNLALSFLAIAILNGFQAEPLEPDAPHLPLRHLEHDPVYRGCIHEGPYSLHVNAQPSCPADGFGIVDITFGPGRFLHFVSSAVHLATGRVFNIGLATRRQAGRSEIHPIAQTIPALLGPIAGGLSASSLRLQARIPGSLFVYELNAWISGEGLEIEESTRGHTGYKTLLVPYPRNLGDGYRTHVRSALSADGAVIRFRHSQELIRLRIQGAVDSILDLQYGYESRRAMVGLLRIDLRDPAESLRYRFTVGR